MRSLTLPYGQRSGREAFARWEDTVASIFDLEAPDAGLNGFAFGFSAWHFGSLVLGVSDGDAIGFGRSKRTIARTAIDHFLVQVYHDTPIHADLEDDPVRIEAGDIWIIDMARGVSIGETAFRSTNLAIPRNCPAPLVKDTDALHGLRVSGKCALGGMAGRFLADIVARADDLTVTQAASVAESIVHLVAGGAGAMDEHRSQFRHAVRTASLTKVRDFVQANLGNPALDADLICKNLGLSRSSLYRLCEPLGGVQGHIRRRRLVQVFKDLIGPQGGRMSAQEIAERWGFSSATTFSRAFREKFDMSPRYARMAGSETDEQAVAQSGDHQGFVDLNRWIHGLMEV